MRVLVIALALCAAAMPAAAQDLDHDGLPDALEQALLERFTPTLLLDSNECNDAPASFKPGLRDPFVLAKDATLYGQAFPVRSVDGRRQVELHFYHLWERDCGRPGHALDAEHVSALVSATRLDAPPAAWTADAWYAAAHENTMCDASSGAQARTLGAENSGPNVFVSRGKHASYFKSGQCKWGCGGDTCDGARVLVPARIVNLGERDAPLNGAVWAQSRRWPLADKLQSDFDQSVRASLDQSGTARIVSLMLHLRAPQSPLLAGDTALDGLATAAASTGHALGATTRAVARFLSRK
jgi:hypothetical protein